MDKLRLLAFCASISLIAPLPVQAVGEFTYDGNTFIIYYSCVGVYPLTSIRLQEKVWIFSKDQAPMRGKVTQVIPAAEAEKKFDALSLDKVRNNKPLWSEIGCVHSFRGDMPVSLARVSAETEGKFDIGFAIRGLPVGAWISKGKGDSVSMGVKDNLYVRAVRHLVTDACYAPDSLTRVKKFPIREGRTIVQLDIGKVKKFSPEKRRQVIEEEMQQAERIYDQSSWPKYKKVFLEELEKKVNIESVEICRFFLDGKRVLKAEKISRRTGVDERVDTAPDLNADSWANTTGSAISFISLNEGKDWDALFVDVGFEGINYSIQRLDSPDVLYSRSLYTSH